MIMLGTCSSPPTAVMRYFVSGAFGTSVTQVRPASIPFAGPSGIGSMVIIYLSPDGSFGIPTASVYAISTFGIAR